MKNKGFYLILVLLLIFVAGFLFWKPKKDTSEVASNQTSQNSANKETSPATSTTSITPATSTTTDKKPSGSTSTINNPDQTQVQYSGEGDIQSPDVQVFEVNYDGTNFTPKTTTIKAGDIVVFNNQGPNDFWPASNPHPTHTDYPEFDAKKSIAPGGKYEFKFIKVGTWGYHDHKNHTATGTIIVK